MGKIVVRTNDKEINVITKRITAGTIRLTLFYHMNKFSGQTNFRATNSLVFRL